MHQATIFHTNLKDLRECGSLGSEDGNISPDYNGGFSTIRYSHEVFTAHAFKKILVL